jgi:serine/threonine protein phosphatase PrpC
MYLSKATAPGSVHINAGQPGKTNNQDALATATFDRGFVAVVCDGCGSQPLSGIGADFGAHAIKRTLLKHLAHTKASELDWSKVTEDLTKILRTEAEMYAENSTLQAFELAVVERFLFTSVVLIVDGERAYVVAFGDGVVIIDDEDIVLEPPILNAPPYMGYLLLQKTAYHDDDKKEHLAFKTIREMPCADIQKGIIIGTDGLTDLLDEDLHHPSLENNKVLQRWMNSMTVERVQNGTFVPGKCSDDVTLVIYRTDASQANLLEGRKEVVQLKEEIRQLNEKVTKVTAELGTTASQREALSNQVITLEARIKKLAPRAAKADVLETHIKTIETKARTIPRDRIRYKKNPLLALIDAMFASLSNDP